MSREHPTLQLVEELPPQAKAAVLHANLQKNVSLEYPPPSQVGNLINVFC